MLEAVPLAFSHDALTLRGGIAPITHRVNTTVAVQVGPTRFANTLRTLVRRSAKGCLIGGGGAGVGLAGERHQSLAAKVPGAYYQETTHTIELAEGAGRHLSGG